MGVALNQGPRVTQVLVFGSICQGAILVHLFEPQPGDFYMMARPGYYNGSCKHWKNALTETTQKEMKVEVSSSELLVTGQNLHLTKRWDTADLGLFCKGF